MGCINIAAQNLAMSVWPQRFRWLTLDEYQQRAGAILAAVAIQLVIEIGMDWRVLRLCQRLVPVDVRRAMRTLASAKNIGTVMLCFGWMTTHSITFWPKCQSCARPYDCLLYMQCMTKGVVRDEKDRNMCRYSYSDKDWSRVDKNIVLLDANISRWELGCDRGDIKCPPSSGSDR